LHFRLVTAERRYLTRKVVGEEEEEEEEEEEDDRMAGNRDR